MMFIGIRSIVVTSIVIKTTVGVDSIIVIVMHFVLTIEDDTKRIIVPTNIDG